jgi:hypothetical protein
MRRGAIGACAMIPLLGLAGCSGVSLGPLPAGDAAYSGDGAAGEGLDASGGGDGVTPVIGSVGTMAEGGSAVPAQDAGVIASAVAACAADTGTCVVGGIFSESRTPGGSDGGALSTVTDDGFEFGAALCDSTGMTCVTGGIVP